MILDRTVGRDVEKFFGHKQRHEGHHLKIGLKRFKLGPHFRFFIGVRLMHRKLGGKRRFLQRVSFRARALRRNVNGDDILAALEQRFEYRFAERLLTVNYDTHIEIPFPLLSSWPGSSRRSCSTGHCRSKTVMPGTSPGMTATLPPPWPAYPVQ